MLRARFPAGFTMIEVLVALALMLAGLAGAGIVLGQSIQYERESGSRRAAIRLAGSPPKSCVRSIAMRAHRSHPMHRDPGLDDVRACSAACRQRCAG